MGLSQKFLPGLSLTLSMEGACDKSPMTDPAPRLPRSLLILLIVLVLLFIAALQSVSIYVESLWFGSLGFESVYWYGYKAQFYVFVAFFLATTLILWVMFRLVIPASRGVRRPLFELNGQMIYLPGLDFVRSWPGRWRYCWEYS